MIRFIVNNKMEQTLLKMSLIKERPLSFLTMLSRQHHLSKTFVFILIITCSACSVLIEIPHSLSEDELNIQYIHKRGRAELLKCMKIISRFNDCLINNIR